MILHTKYQERQNQTNTDLYMFASYITFPRIATPDLINLALNNMVLFNYWKNTTLNTGIHLES